MALYQQYTYVDANTVLVNLGQFLLANGWIIDTDSVYNTSYRRLHAHKGALHFDAYTQAGTTINFYGCTGWASGSAPSAQPGVSGLKTFQPWVVGQPYWFVSVDGGVYIGVSNGTNIAWSFLLYSFPKIGAWNDGFAVCGTVNGVLLGQNMHTAVGGNSQLYINGAWTPLTAAGSLQGSIFVSDMPASKGINYYNGGIVPQPVVLFVNNSSDSSKRHPIGYAPGLYRANGSDIYSIIEEIIIGADTYVILPSWGNAIGNFTYGDFLFKIGA